MLYRVLHTVIPPVAKAIWRPTVRGLENIPSTGGVILASNHLSFIDSVVIPVVVKRKVVFLAKSDYFTGPGVKGALSRAWFETMPRRRWPASTWRSRCWAGARRSASTPRGRAHGTAGSTAAAPASPTSR